MSSTVHTATSICHTGYGGQGYCPEHVETYSKNKFEKLVFLVGFVVRK